MYKIDTKNWLGEYDLTKVQDSHPYFTRLSKNSNYCLRKSTLCSTEGALSVIGPKTWMNVPYAYRMLPFHLFKKKP